VQGARWSLASRIQSRVLAIERDVFSITPGMIPSTFRLFLFPPWSVVLYPLSICEMTFLTSLDRPGRARFLRYYPADSEHLVRFFVVQQE
jgi:hypothetical protein